jgi:hypothetical protein
MQNAVNDSIVFLPIERGTTPIQLHMAINPLSFNIFIHPIQVSSSSAVFDCNRKIPSTVFLRSFNLVCLLKYKENNIT